MQHANAVHGTTSGYLGASYIERTDGTNQTQRQDIDSTTLTTYTLNTESSYHPVSHWYDFHRFTIVKTVSGYDIGLDIHDGSSWNTYVGTGGSLQATPWSVTSLPNTLNVVAFNDQSANNSAGGPILPFIDVGINTIDLSPSLLKTQTVTTNGSATLSNGILNLPGASTDYASLPATADVTTDMTYSAWVYLDHLPNDQGAIIGNLQPGNWYSGFSIQIATGVVSSSFEGLRIACNNSAGGGSNQNDDFAVSGGISTGAWHFVAMTFELTASGPPAIGTARAYFNGVEIGSISNATIGNNTGHSVVVGALIMGSQKVPRTLDGQITGVRIDQTLKSESELLTIYNAGPQ